VACTPTGRKRWSFVVHVDLRVDGRDQRCHSSGAMHQPKWPRIGMSFCFVDALQDLTQHIAVIMQVVRDKGRARAVLITTR
jgi:hypothetical protein